MSFGSVVGRGDVAAEADVVLRAITGEFKSDIREAEEVYERSLKQMSTESIKLALAQDKLDRTLSKYPPTSRQVARAELERRRLIDQVAASTHRLERETHASTVAVGRFGRVAGAGGGLVRGLGSQMTVATGSMLAAGGLVYAMRESIASASDLNEQVSRSAVVFGASSGEIERWSRTAVDKLSLTRAQALQAAGDFGTLFTTVGLGAGQVSELSRQMVQLGADLSSFQNTPLEDSLAALRSGLVGEAEPLRRYGALLSEARVQQEALAESGKTNVKELTDQEKVLARVTLIMRDTTAAQGDLARTSDSYANQTRKLNAELADLKAQAGTVLLPLATEGVKDANRFIGALDKAGVTAERVGVVIKESALNAIPVYGLVHSDLLLINAALGDTKKKLDDVTAAQASAFGAQFGLGALTTAAGLKTRPDEGSRSPGTTDRANAAVRAKKAAGDGLTRLQRLELASRRALLTKSLADDLKTAGDEVDYYRKLAANSKLHGDKLYAARSNLLAALQHEQDIRDQIDADRQAAIDKAAAKRRAADEKRLRTQRAEAARRKAAEDAIRRAGLTAGPYATTSSGFAGGRPVDNQAFGTPKKTGSKNPDDEIVYADGKPVTVGQLRQAVSEAMTGLVQINKSYGSTVRPVTVNQHFTTTPTDYFAEAAHAKAAFIAHMQAGT